MYPAPLPRHGAPAGTGVRRGYLWISSRAAWGVLGAWLVLLACIDARRTQFRAADWSVVGAHHLHPVYRLALRALGCDERCGRAILARLDMDPGRHPPFSPLTIPSNPP